MIDAFELQPWQVPGYLEEKNGVMAMHGVQLPDLAEEYGTPLFIYSERKLRENARRIHHAFQNIHPKTSVCYASKACSNIAVLKVLRDEGLEIEVNSGGEHFKAVTAGYLPKQISFNGVSKTDLELRQAMATAIKVINVDSIFELKRIIALAAKTETCSDIALRIVPEIEGGTTPGCETGSSTSKFGILQKELNSALREIKDNPNQVRLTGLHIHIGSQVSDPSAYSQAAIFIAKLASEIQEEVRTISHVNIGGGYPVNYVKYNDPLSGSGYFNTPLTPEMVAEISLPVLIKYLGAEIEVLIEPGRSMVADAAVMLTKVESEKYRNASRWLGLDAGYHTLLEIKLYKWYYHAVNATRAVCDETENFRIFGPLCDSGDAFFDVDGESRLSKFLEQNPDMEFARDKLEAMLVGLPSFRQLPEKTQSGDVIAFLDTGAYTLDQIYAVNGRLRPAVVMLGTDNKTKLIRRGDTQQDLLLNEVY